MSDKKGNRCSHILDLRFPMVDIRMISQLRDPFQVKDSDDQTARKQVVIHKD